MKWDDEDLYDYRDQMWFKAFTDRVYKALRKKPQTWRQVRTRLKDDPYLHLIVEAVEYLEGKGAVHWDRGYIETLALPYSDRPKSHKHKWGTILLSKNSIKKDLTYT